jgi:sugar phosphate permease
LGKRCGYSCFGGAVIVFLFHYYIEGSSLLTSITVALLIIGSLILAPAIILGYAANAADREDQGLPHGH